MTHGLTIILEDSIPLADSREIAKQLGIEHRSFFRMILEYQQEVEEDFGILRLLVKGFAEAREQLHQLERQQQTFLPTINHLWQKRLALFNERTRIPDGYWCVFNEIAAVCWSLESRGHISERMRYRTLAWARCGVSTPVTSDSTCPWSGNILITIQIGAGCKLPISTQTPG